MTGAARTLALSVDVWRPDETASGGPLQRIVYLQRRNRSKSARFLVGTRAVDDAGNPDCES